MSLHGNGEIGEIEIDTMSEALAVSWARIWASLRIGLKTHSVTTMEMRTKGSRGWMDWTKRLPPLFEGESREKILAVWEEHFRTKGIITRRMRVQPKASSSNRRDHRGRDWVKLQIWTD